MWMFDRTPAFTPEHPLGHQLFIRYRCSCSPRCVHMLLLIRICVYSGVYSAAAAAGVGSSCWSSCISCELPTCDAILEDVGGRRHTRINVWGRYYVDGYYYRTINMFYKSYKRKYVYTCRTSSSALRSQFVGKYPSSAPNEMFEAKFNIKFIFY